MSSAQAFCWGRLGYDLPITTTPERSKFTSAPCVKNGSELAKSIVNVLGHGYKFEE